MKKYTRRHYPLLLTVIFVIAAALSVPRGCVYGSTTDWLPQHIALAETIRAACAEQGTLLPAFLPLGGGSNGFLFSYYGYLRPDILLGCVLRRVPMLFLVIGYMLAGYLASVLLFYRLLLDDGQKEFAAFWGSMLFPHAQAGNVCQLYAVSARGASRGQAQEIRVGDAVSGAHILQ